MCKKGYYITTVAFQGQLSIQLGCRKDNFGPKEQEMKVESPTGYFSFQMIKAQRVRCKISVKQYRLIPSVAWPSVGRNDFIHKSWLEILHLALKQSLLYHQLGKN